MINAWPGDPHLLRCVIGPKVAERRDDILASMEFHDEMFRGGDGYGDPANDERKWRDAGIELCAGDNFTAAPPPYGCTAGKRPSEEYGEIGQSRGTVRFHRRLHCRSAKTQISGVSADRAQSFSPCGPKHTGAHRMAMLTCEPGASPAVSTSETLSPAGAPPGTMAFTW